MSALSKMFGLSAAAGFSTYIYNKAAEKEFLGQHAPYIHPPEIAGLTVGISTLFARAISKNPKVVAIAGLSSFAALCAYGDYKNTLRAREWALYEKCGVIPSKKVLQMEIEHADSYRKDQARDLLGVLATKEQTVRS